MLKNCVTCGKEFKSYRKCLEYCSRQCSGLSRRLTGPCTLCGAKHAWIRPTGLEGWYNHPTTGKTICSSCYGKIPRKGLCVECGLTECRRWSSNEKGIICNNCAMVLYRQNLKLEVLTHYCNGKLCCSEKGCTVDDIDMLALDHTNNDGAAHRKELGVKAGTFMYEWA